MSNLNIIRGDDVVLKITFKDSDGVATDITGGTVFFTLKNKLTDLDASALITKEITDFDHSDDDITAGIMHITLSNEDTEIDPGDYFYDVQLILDGQISSSDRGRVSILRDVTRRIS